MHFLRFPVQEGTETYKLYTFLHGKDGGSKTDKDATKNTTDVSKCLYFCGRKLNWDHLLDISKIESFLCKVKEAGCSADTKRKYILAIHHALNYLKLCRMDMQRPPASFTHRCDPGEIVKVEKGAEGKW